MTEDEIQIIPEDIKPSSPLVRVMLVAFAALVVIAIVWAFSTGRLP